MNSIKRVFAKSCSGLLLPVVSHHPMFLGRKHVLPCENTLGEPSAVIKRCASAAIPSG